MLLIKIVAQYIHYYIEKDYNYIFRYYNIAKVQKGRYQLYYGVMNIHIAAEILRK